MSSLARLLQPTMFPITLTLTGLLWTLTCLCHLFLVLLPLSLGVLLLFNCVTAIGLVLLVLMLLRLVCLFVLAILAQLACLLVLLVLLIVLPPALATYYCLFLLDLPHIFPTSASEKSYRPRWQCSAFSSELRFSEGQ